MDNPKSAPGIGRNPQSPQSMDGFLLIDKPRGLTSHDVVALARKILKTRRIGHTGTLDPFATGLLVVCVDRATRLSQFVVADEKEYLATMRLGFATDTADVTGSPVTPISDSRHLTPEILEEAFSHFRGRIKQTPPMYSAKKIGGVKLYEFARQGREVERVPVEIEIKELELSKCPITLPVLSPSDELNETRVKSHELTVDFTFRVVCTSGTYIRTLAEDIGRNLGVGAHLIALRRTRVGKCNLDQAITLEMLRDFAIAGRVRELIIPPADIVQLENLEIDENECVEIAHGRPIKRSGDWQDEEQIKLCDSSHRLIAIAGYDRINGLWHPRIVLIQ